MGPNICTHLFVISPPLLFRATSLGPVKAYARGLTINSTTYRVSHRHGNVLSADAFQRGVVRSRTDYSVYHSESGKFPSTFRVVLR